MCRTDLTGGSEGSSETSCICDPPPSDNGGNGNGGREDAIAPCEAFLCYKRKEMVILWDISMIQKTEFCDAQHSFIKEIIHSTPATNFIIYLVTGKFSLSPSLSLSKHFVCE